MENPLWQDNSIQFPRLIAEIQAVGLTPAQLELLEDSMDLHPVEIDELFERAEQEWEQIKEKHCS